MLAGSPDAGAAAGVSGVSVCVWLAAAPPPPPHPCSSPVTVSTLPANGSNAAQLHICMSTIVGWFAVCGVVARLSKSSRGAPRIVAGCAPDTEPLDPLMNDI
uniref:Uncharacterized protein n=1 Tax=Anopheles darlingi TaxID=43151 RepID=A0A2M4DI43_ANODA